MKYTIAEILFASAMLFSSCESATQPAPASAPPSIQLSHKELRLTAPQGEEPAIPIVTIQNGGGGTLTGLNITFGVEENGPQGWLDPRLSSASAPALLTVRAKTSSFKAGNYYGLVIVESSQARNTPQTIDVYVTVTPK